MLCPYCHSNDSRVINTTAGTDEIRRRRHCQHCGKRYTTVERIRMQLPLVKKESQNGLSVRTEPFDRQKLRQGIDIACAKRPIPPSAIERLLDDIEAKLLNDGRDEVSSKTIGELVIVGLRGLDEIAYIRYAIVFLGLGNLAAVRDEIDALLKLRSSWATLEN